MTTAKQNILTVFEHDTLKLHNDRTLLEALQDFHGENGVPYFSLGNNCVKFCEYVGVIQIGKTTIEVLPKADHTDSKAAWREALIGMLRSVGVFDVEAPSSSTLNVKHNSILDLYFELFIKEVEHLVHLGLVKKYKKADGNCNSLKGNLLFGEQIQKNLIRKERFFTRHTVYDVQHPLHQILYKAILLLQQLNSNTALTSRMGSLLLHFPEQSDIRVTEAMFEKIIFNRKTEHYRKAIEIARLLLLNYHPDVRTGKNHVLALMFDMNMLWERFVFVSIRAYLRKQLSDYRVIAQASKYFWKPAAGYRSSIKADIVFKYGPEQDKCVVLDTKWKNLNGSNPSPDDLRQLYVYHEFYDAQKVALVYPGNFGIKKGIYYDKHHQLSDKECSVMGIKVITDISKWQTEIGTQVLQWVLGA
ncbi:McrC family protein [Chitinophaga filiformis]|uniref:5-methylcytosine-specific restriction enzyme subunit McrC n=1 Tax=Chitinophaga filiformis TaxID=104663 RepID=A0A1G7QTI8_CHIFI|nr:restriction endonuclease [Chitinophaga filiformis]SDG01827.1 5-methylcytosine-specific restriction enzyme subunit McrC [Chitinophaga filiformis]